MYMIPKLMDYAADTSATGENYAAEPTGSTLYNANGTFFNVNGNAVTPKGTIADGLITPTAVTTGGSNGLITPTWRFTPGWLAHPSPLPTTLFSPTLRHSAATASRRLVPGSRWELQL